MKDLVRAWQRPKKVDFPKKWISKDGYVVRDVTSDLDKYVIQHMADQNAHDSPTLKSIGIAKDAHSMAEMAQNWKNQLSQRVSLVLLKEDSPGANLQPVGSANPPQVLGANIMSVTSRIDNFPPMNEIADAFLLRRLYTAKMTFVGSIDVFTEFGVDCVLDTNGMSVDRDIRGKGLGRMLLEARLEMCRELAIPLTKSTFVSEAAQKIAAKVGFELIKETPFSKLLDSDGIQFYNDLYHTMQLCVYKL